MLMGSFDDIMLLRFIRKDKSFDFDIEIDFETPAAEIVFSDGDDISFTFRNENDDKYGMIVSLMSDILPIIEDENELETIYVFLTDLKEEYIKLGILKKED